MIRAAGYCRVSTDHTDQINSFEAQQRYFREYIEHREDWELYRIFADAGISGTGTKKRVQFNRMMEEARQGRFDIIITKEVSRFSRNILDTIAFTRELRALRVGVIFLTDGINTLDPDAELRLSIMASIAQEESRRTSARVKWGQTRQMEQGVVFGHSLLGYTLKKGKLTIDQAGAVLVRRIFEDYAYAGKSACAIAGALTDEGIPTSKGKTLWTAAGVLKILKNEKYCGDLIQKKTYTPDYLTHLKKPNSGEEPLVVIRNHHESIVSRELWEKVQDEIYRRRRKNGGKREKFPLSGKIFCGECSAVFVSRNKKRKDGSVYRRWGCMSAALHGKKHSDKNGRITGCDIGRLLRDDIAMKIIAETLDKELHEHGDIADDVISKILSESECRTKSHASSTAAKHEKAVEEYLSGHITVEELDLIRRKYDREERLLNLPSPADTDRDTLVLLGRKILAGEELSTPFWQTVINRITVQKDGTVFVELTKCDTIYRFRLT